MASMELLMQKKYVFALLFILLYPSLTTAETINMQVIIYPPLAYERDDELMGVAPDVVRAIQEMVGDDNPIKVTPWLRAYRLAQTEARQALFAIVRIPEREELFKWVGPVFSEGDYFFKRKGSDLTIRSLDDARAVKSIAVRKEGYTHQALKGRNFQNLDISPSYDSSYKKLVEGRVDLVLMGERTYIYMVRKAGLKPEQFERTQCKLDDSSAWLAFSRDTPDELIEKWQEALDTLKANGTYAEIMRRNFQEN